MIQAGFFSVFNFIANNRAAQVAVTAGFVVFVWLMNNRHQRHVGYRKAEDKIEKKSRKVQTQIRKSNNEKSTQVERARDAAPRNVPHSDGVRDDLNSVLFGDRGNVQ